MARAKNAAIKIFGIMEVPSEIDAQATKDTGRTIVPEALVGVIEFKDVWFRYPTRLDQWILKGFNLTIN